MPRLPETPTTGNAAAGGLGEQAFDDGFADRLRLADGGLEMHQQAGAGVHFDDGAVLLGQRLGDVLRNDIHAGDVEADNLGREHGGGGVARMDQMGDVGRVVAVAQHDHALTFGGHRIRFEALLLQLQQRLRLLVEIDELERLMQLGAAARIAVDLQLDQFADRVLAVAGARWPLRRAQQRPACRR